MSTFNHSEIYHLKTSVEYSPDSVVSKIVTKNESGNISLFSFDGGQSLSKHTAAFDAFVQVLEGKARVVIGDSDLDLGEGDSVIMPANVPHAIEAREKFKMLLVMIKG